MRPIRAIVANDIHFIKLVHGTSEQCNWSYEEQDALKEHDKVFSDQRACISEHLSEGPYLFKL
jgi:hypothetical protein